MTKIDSKSHCYSNIVSSVWETGVLLVVIVGVSAFISKRVSRYDVCNVADK